MALLMSDMVDYGELILDISWLEASLGFLILCARFFSVWRILGRVRADFYIALSTFVSPDIVFINT